MTKCICQNSSHRLKSCFNFIVIVSGTCSYSKVLASAGVDLVTTRNWVAITSSSMPPGLLRHGEVYHEESFACSKLEQTSCVKVAIVIYKLQM